jgi:hypothetical protein
MTVPLTLALVLPLRERMRTPAHIALGVALVAPRASALLLTLSRSPALGLAIASIVFVVLTAKTSGAQAATRVFIILLLATAISLAATELLLISGRGDAEGTRSAEQPASLPRSTAGLAVVSPSGAPRCRHGLALLGPTRPNSVSFQS